MISVDGVERTRKQVHRVHNARHAPATDRPLPLEDELQALILKYEDCPGITSDLLDGLANLRERGAA